MQRSNIGSDIILILKGDRYRGKIDNIRTFDFEVDLITLKLERFPSDFSGDLEPDAYSQVFETFFESVKIFDAKGANNFIPCSIIYSDIKQLAFAEDIPTPSTRLVKKVLADKGVGYTIRKYNGKSTRCYKYIAYNN